MNGYLIAAGVLLLALVPPGIVCWRGPTMADRIVGLQCATVVTTLVLLLLAAGYEASTYTVTAVALAIMSPIGGLVAARFLERWL